jgi:hypothetical protein
VLRTFHGAGSSIPPERTTVHRPSSPGFDSCHHTCPPAACGKDSLIRDRATSAAVIGDGQVPYANSFGQSCGRAEVISSR